MGLLEWLGGLPHAVLLRQSATLYILVNAAHILGVGLLAGSILPLDLRLIGILKEGPIGVLAPFLVRVAATGLGLAVVTGFLLFSVKPGEYAGNPAFLVKMGLVVLGLINVFIQHRNGGWALLREGGTPSTGVRMLAAFSFTIWLAVLLAGRWIGFL